MEGRRGANDKHTTSTHHVAYWHLLRATFVGLVRIPPWPVFVATRRLVIAAIIPRRRATVVARATVATAVIVRVAGAAEARRRRNGAMGEEGNTPR